MSGFASTFILSCDKDTSTPLIQVEKPNLPVTQRSCPTDYCEFTIKTDNDAYFDLCGELPAGNSCSFSGCNVGDFGVDGLFFPSGVPVTLCVKENGTISIRNYSTAPTIGIEVNFSGTPIITTITAGSIKSFNTNSDCTETDDGCM
jgi:hypothetical protein